MQYTYVHDCSCKSLHTMFHGPDRSPISLSGIKTMKESQRMQKEKNEPQYSSTYETTRTCNNKTRLMSLMSLEFASGYLFPANCASPTSCTLAPSLASTTTPDARAKMAHFGWVSDGFWFDMFNKFNGFSMAAMPEMHPDPTNFSRNGPIFK